MLQLHDPLVEEDGPGQRVDGDDADQDVEFAECDLCEGEEVEERAHQVPHEQENEGVLHWLV